jgi:hypothetical protein
MSAPAHDGGVSLTPSGRGRAQANDHRRDLSRSAPPSALGRTLAAISCGTGWGVAIAAPVAIAAGDGWRSAFLGFAAGAESRRPPIAVFVSAPRSPRSITTSPNQNLTVRRAPHSRRAGDQAEISASSALLIKENDSHRRRPFAAGISEPQRVGLLRRHVRSLGLGERL